jgi:uncharacterized protein YbjT (DUF2867 family)
VRLLVTGAGGFVGGHLVALVRREAADTSLHGVVQPHGSLAWSSSSGARIHEADLDDPACRAASSR